MKIKKLLSLLLVLLAISALPLGAFADGTGTASITINNAVNGYDYKLYKLFSMTKVSDQQYDYEVTAAWKDFFTNGSGASYITLNNGHPNWIKGKIKGEPTAADVQELAKCAKTFASGVKPLATVKASSSVVCFGGLECGYYFIDSPAGTLCILHSVGEDVTITEKNEAPGLTKTVSTTQNGTPEDPAYSLIDGDLYFTTTITVGKGTNNYALHDYPESGITVTTNSIVVKAGDNVIQPGSETYTLNIAPSECKWTPDKTELTCAFEIKFADGFLTEGKVITVSYQGKLTKDVDFPSASKNYARLTHSAGEVDDDAAVTTLGFDLIKVSKKNDWSQQLSGAKFKLYDSPNAQENVKLVKISDEKYRLAESGEEGQLDEIETKGKPILVYGLKKQTYYLEETQAPTGYNLLTQRESFDLSNGSIRYTNNGTLQGGVQILNQQGTQLPSTGGMGTTIFYVLGGCIAVAALVLLIVKKRMDREA